MELIRPKEFNSESGTFILSKFPATIGREIMFKYPIGNIPKLASYLESEQAMLLLMQHVEKKLPDRNLRLDSKILINQHIEGGGEELIKIEYAVLCYNYSFLPAGGISEIWTKCRTTLEESATKILMNWWDMLSQRKPPRLKN